MGEFELGGKTFSIRRLNAFDQCDLSRRVAPLLPIVLPAVQSLFDEAGKDLDTMDLATSVVVRLHPVFSAISAMAQDDYFELLKLCLKNVQVKTADRAFHDLMKDGQIMYDDLPYEVLHLLCIKSCIVNLRPTIPLAAFTQAVSSLTESDKR